MCASDSSLFEEICDRSGDGRTSWWHCKNARTSPRCDQHGVVLLHGKPCETNYCSDCVRHNVANVVRALHLVKPGVLVTVNDVAADHREALRRMNAIRRHLRDRARLDFQDLFVLERYTARDHPGLHTHLFGHGDLPDEHQLLRAAETAGVDLSRSERPVDVQPVTHHGNLAYLFKATRSESTLKPFLDDNGGSLVHTSRGFWRLPGQPPTPGGYRGLLRQARRLG